MSDPASDKHMSSCPSEVVCLQPSVPVRHDKVFYVYMVLGWIRAALGAVSNAVKSLSLIHSKGDTHSTELNESDFGFQTVFQLHHHQRDEKGDEKRGGNGDQYQHWSVLRGKWWLCLKQDFHATSEIHVPKTIRA